MTYSQGTTAVIVAAGKSVRAGQNKLALLLGNQSVLLRTLSCFSSLPIVLVCDNPPAEVSDMPWVTVVKGGSTRAESVRNGLDAVLTDKVLIHDGARPFVSQRLIKAVVDGVEEYRSAVPAIKPIDSIRMIDGDRMVGFPARDALVAVQTPQGFYTADIVAAYKQFSGAATDDAEVYASVFGAVYAVEGEAGNIKITTKEDVLGVKSNVGSGFDLHKLGDEKPLVLLGIKVAENGGAYAHSDGDAALHAVTDAVLSALGEGDIGARYPDTDPKYKGANSVGLLQDTLMLCRDKGKTLCGLSVVICMDKPKLMSFVPLMRDRLSAICGLPTEKVGITVKTTENTAPNTVSCWAVVTLV